MAHCRAVAGSRTRPDHPVRVQGLGRPSARPGGDWHGSGWCHLVNATGLDQGIKPWQDGGVLKLPPLPYSHEAHKAGRDFRRYLNAVLECGPGLVREFVRGFCGLPW